MKNFGRVLRITLRYRATLVVAVICAVTVAVLWGGSISAVYPVVEVVLRGQTMSQWVDDRAEYGVRTKAEFEEKAADIERMLALRTPAELRGALTARREVLERTLPAERDHVTQNEIAKLQDWFRIASDRDLRETLKGQLAEARIRVDAEADELARVRWVQPYIHAYAPNDAFQTLVYVFAFLLGITLLKDVFVIGSAISVARLAQLTSLQLRKDLYDHILATDLASISQQSRGDMMSRMTGDVGAVSRGVSTLFGRALREPLKMVACLVGAAIVSWRLLLLSLIVVPVTAYLISRLARSIKRANRRAMEKMALVYNRLTETLGGIKAVKAFTMEGHERQRFDTTARQHYQQAMKIARYDALVSPLNEVTAMIMITLAVLVGAYLSLSHETDLFGIKISDRRLSTGACMAFYAFLAGMSEPARKLAGVFAGVQGAVAASDRIFAVMDRAPTVADPKSPRRLPRHSRDLVFEGVDFSYDPQQPVLQNVNLQIAFGETIAIVGANGCGKSTLANLIPRFFDPTSGSVKLDGIDLREVRQHDLRRQIGLVTQETLLFDDTIFDNIRYGSPDAPREQVIAAAHRAHAHDFIETKLSDGYNTRVGAGGQRLSGGQRQRIALARAILRDPMLLVLDEATSQIDLESEQLIHLALQQFIADRTTVIITHRLTILTLADRILVLDQGRIVDVGSHEQLLARCDLYRRLHQVDLKQTA